MCRSATQRMPPSFTAPAPLSGVHGAQNHLKHPNAPPNLDRPPEDAHTGGSCATGRREKRTGTCAPAVRAPAVRTALASGTPDVNHVDIFERREV